MSVPGILTGGDACSGVLPAYRGAYRSAGRPDRRPRTRGWPRGSAWLGHMPQICRSRAGGKSFISARRRVICNGQGEGNGRKRKPAGSSYSSSTKSPATTCFCPWAPCHATGKSDRSDYTQTRDCKLSISHSLSLQLSHPAFTTSDESCQMSSTYSCHRPTQPSPSGLSGHEESAPSDEIPSQPPVSQPVNTGVVPAGYLPSSRLNSDLGTTYHIGSSSMNSSSWNSTKPPLPPRQ